MTKSKFHIIYWLKWYFVVRPKVRKAIDKAIAEMVDKILNDLTNGDGSGGHR